MTSQTSQIRVARERIRIVHVSSAHAWSDNRIHLREGASLVAAGYEVNLVALEDDLSLPETGVRPILLPPRPRLSRLVLGSAAAVAAALRTRALVFHLHDPELIWAVPLLRALGKKVIYDAHEDLPAQVLDKHYLPQPVRRPMAALSRLAMRVAGMSDHIIAATEGIAKTFPADRTSVVRNYPRLRDGVAELAPVVERAQGVAYIGALSEERGSVQMIDSFASGLFPDDWHATIAGSSSPPGLLDRLKARPGWSRVDFRGQIAPAAARELLADSRVGLLLLNRTPAFVDSLPTKMFEYFAEGVPVIASDFPLWRTIIERHQCGQVVDETDPDAIAQAIQRYAEEPELLACHSKNALEAARTVLNWATEESTLVAVYDDLVLRNRQRLRQL